MPPNIEIKPKIRMQQENNMTKYVIFVLTLLLLTPLASAIKFTQPDTVIPDLYDPQSLNRYSYVSNNPYKYVDPTGHWFSPLDFLDYASFGDSLKNMIQDPSWGNLAWLTLDSVCVALPVIGGLGVTGKGIKYGFKGINAIDKTKDVVKVNKATDLSKLSKTEMKKLNKINNAKYVDSIYAKYPTNPKKLPKVHKTGESHVLKRYDANGRVYQTRSYAPDGRALYDVDFTNHGRLTDHTPYHGHSIEYSNANNLINSKLIHSDSFIIGI